MSNKNRKARQKKWYKARQKEQQRDAWSEAFRNHFIRKGILKGENNEIQKNCKNDIATTLGHGK